MEILGENLQTVPRIEPPWDYWLVFDNRPRIIERGTDYSETSKTMKRNLITEAAKRGFDITASAIKGDRILFQVFTPGNDIPVLPDLGDARKKYPWHLWLNGEEHEIRQGVDFDVSPETMKAHIYKTSADRGLKVEIRWPFEDVAVVRAYKPEGTK